MQILNKVLSQVQDKLKTTVNMLSLDEWRGPPLGQSAANMSPCFNL